MTLEQRLDILHRLRSARALVLADAEAFVDAATVLEYVGQIGGGNHLGGLGAHRDAIVNLAKETGRFAKKRDERELRCLFDTVLNARNSAAHTGAWARHLSSRLVELILIIEEAIIHGEPQMSEKNSANANESDFRLTQVRHLMASGPVIAYDWNTLGQVRTMILEHSFTFIPVKRAEDLRPRWVMISDAWLMAFLRKASSRRAWKDGLGTTVSKALADQTDQELHRMAAQFCVDNDSIDSMVDRIRETPLLVRPANHPEEVIGIITAYDLL